MPFYKWIIDSKDLGNENRESDNEVEESSANRKLVEALRQLSRLVQIAEDVFSGISEECEFIHGRSEALRNKVRFCEEIVVSLNAKTVPVPVGDVAQELQLKSHFATHSPHHEREIGLLGSDNRPTYVRHLRQLAAATPVSAIRSMDRCRTDGRPGSRLYMCTPILGDPPTTDLDSEAGTPRPSSFCGSRSSADTEHQETESDSQQPNMEFPSTVVPIDVSGHPFKRMTSFRRSLIHVDFLIRRKKKKKAKRRNTVAEGETKELSEALQKVAIENHIAPIPITSSNSSEAVEADPVSMRKEETTTAVEENNNFYSRGETRNPCSNSKSGDNVDLKVSREWRPGRKGKNFDQLEKKMKDTSGCKKKSRGYIPISTLSAAMTVAVKMRQTFSGNKTEDAQSSSGNWSGSSSGRASLDSDQQRTSSGPAASVTSPTHSLISKDSLLSENTRPCKNSRIMEGVPVTDVLQCTETSSAYDRAITLQREEEERNPICSSLDGERGTVSEMDGEESVASSLDTDGYFPSYPTDSGLRTSEDRTESFESDDDDDDSNVYYLEDKYGSSASLSTISNGSLNSLLSRTATELSSSSSTLTWTFKSPPPPPPRVSSIKGDDDDDAAAGDIVSKTERIEEEYSQSTFSSVSDNEVPKVYPVLNGNIQNKAMTNSNLDPSPNDKTSSDYAIPKTVYEEHKGPKTILSNLIKKKFHSKEEQRKEKPKHYEKVKQHNKKSPPRFSMYGDLSPSKPQLTPSFIQGRRSPVVADEPKSPLVSFVPSSSQQNSFRSESPQVSPASPPCQLESNFERPPEPSITIPETIHQPSTVNTSNPESPIIYSEIKTATVRAGTPVPLKYAHQITVTPVRRQPKTENFSAQTTSPDGCSRSPESHYTSANSSTWSSQSSCEKRAIRVSPDHSNYAATRRGPLVQSNNHCNSSPETEESQINSRVSSDNFQPYLQTASTRPQRPSSLASDYSCKPAARVILDPEGRVIFSSNSLDRRRVGYQTMHSQSFSPEPPSDSKFATLPMCQNQAVNSYHEEFSPVTNQGQNSVQDYTARDSPPEHYQHSIYAPVSEHRMIPGRGHYIPATVNNTYNSHRLNGISENSRSSPTNFYGSTRYQFSPQERNTTIPKGFHHSSDVSQVSNATSEYLNSMPVNRNFHSPSGLRSSPATPLPSSHQKPSHHAIVSSPHYPSPLTQQNVSLHSQRMSRLSPSSECTSNISSSSECSYDLMSPPPFTPTRYGPSTSPCSDIQQQKRKPMTTEDLFAVIHNSKKRLNIKTDSDISVTPSSSRSSSPSYNRSVPSVAGTPKGGLAETGFLSPRCNNGSQGNARDRRSWADFRSPPGSVGERRCLASDRMGPNKPTSMHDFKMLLLQARSSNQGSGGRISAVEQLMKVPVSQPHYHYSPMEHHSFATSSVQNSPTAEMCFYNGHSTVPFKRSSRARASLQARYVMYPPIFEDCSEEAESSRDPQKSPVLKTSQPKTDDCSTSGLHPSSHITYNRCATPLQPVPQGEFAASSMWV